MSYSTEPFTIAIPDSQLDDLSQRLNRTIWPDDPSNDDWSYGVNGDYLKQLVGYWIKEFDWRKQERRMNVFPNFMAIIDGVRVHYVYRKGNGPNPIPVIMTHGWPWTYWDMHKVIDPLADPEKFGGRPEDAFDVVVPSLPGYGFSGPPQHAGLSFWRVADLWEKLMVKVLGHSRYAASGGDWGALISSQLGHKYPESLFGVHLMHPMLLDQFNTDRPWDVTARAWDTGQKPPPANTKFVSHFAVQVLHPQTSLTRLAILPSACWHGCWNAGDPGAIAKEILKTSSARTI